MKKSFVLLAVILFTAVLRGGVIQETIEAAAKVSGKVLSSSSGKAAGKILTKVVQQYGDDALKVVKTGGLKPLNKAENTVTISGNWQNTLLRRLCTVWLCMPMNLCPLPKESDLSLSILKTKYPVLLQKWQQNSVTMLSAILQKMLHPTMFPNSWDLPEEQILRQQKSCFLKVTGKAEHPSSKNWIQKKFWRSA